MDHAPQEVELQAIRTMSRGSHSNRLVRPSSRTSTSSSSSTRSSRSPRSSPSITTIQRILKAVFSTSEGSFCRIEQIGNCLHQVYLARLADGNTAVLKCPPSQNVRTLRHERHLLETEHKTLSTIHDLTQLRVPRVLSFGKEGDASGIPFLVLSFLPGQRLSEIAPSLTNSEQETIDRQLGFYTRALTSLSAPQFGTTHRVSGKKGCKTWREAFLALLEASLRDAEDMLVTVPYESIRYWIGRNSHFLDEVTEPRLVALNACEPENVLVDEDTRRVTGLVGFSNVVWGDPLMCGGIAGGSDAFFEGFGECPARRGGVKARLLMYATYRAIVTIVAQHYRPHLPLDEYAARHNLSYALNDLAQI